MTSLLTLCFLLLILFHFIFFCCFFVTHCFTDSKISLTWVLGPWNKHPNYQNNISWNSDTMVYHQYYLALTFRFLGLFLFPCFKHPNYQNIFLEILKQWCIINVTLVLEHLVSSFLCVWKLCTRLQLSLWIHHRVHRDILWQDYLFPWNKHLNYQNLFLKI